MKNIINQASFQAKKLAATFYDAAVMPARIVNECRKNLVSDEVSTDDRKGSLFIFSAMTLPWALSFGINPVNFILIYSLQAVALSAIEGGIIKGDNMLQKDLFPTRNAVINAHKECKETSANTSINAMASPPKFD